MHVEAASFNSSDRTLRRMSADGSSPDAFAHDRLIEAVALRRDREAFARLRTH